MDMRSPCIMNDELFEPDNKGTLGRPHCGFISSQRMIAGSSPVSSFTNLKRKSVGIKTYDKKTCQMVGWQGANNTDRNFSNGTSDGESACKKVPTNKQWGCSLI